MNTPLRAFCAAAVCTATFTGSCTVPSAPPAPSAALAPLPGPAVMAVDTTELGQRYHTGPLTAADFQAVAKELGVDVAAIKAVAEIEAGRTHRGFWADGRPVVNLDLSMMPAAARRAGTTVGAIRKAAPAAFNRRNAPWRRLDAALAANRRAAIESTFWGMFQIGGFNWKKCGADSPEHFMEMMSRSERDQLELFARFLQSTGLDRHLRAHDWRSFARGYNGASYARQGYHTRMANAYRRYKAHPEAAPDL